MSREKYKYLGGRTVTVTCLGTITNDEAIDILAEIIAKAIHNKRKEQTNENN